MIVWEEVGKKCCNNIGKQYQKMAEVEGVHTAVGKQLAEQWKQDQSHSNHPP